MPQRGGTSPEVTPLRYQIRLNRRERYHGRNRLGYVIFRRRANYKIMT